MYTHNIYLMRTSCMPHWMHHNSYSLINTFHHAHNRFSICCTLNFLACKWRYYLRLNYHFYWGYGVSWWGSHVGSRNVTKTPSFQALHPGLVQSAWLSMIQSRKILPRRLHYSGIKGWHCFRRQMIGGWFALGYISSRCSFSLPASFCVRVCRCHWGVVITK